jgi:DNA-binding NarL/FixJ family response regulator
MIRVGIVEDNRVVRESLRDWVEGESRCRCVCLCSTVKEALAQIPQQRPQVVLMDIHLPDASGIVCTAKLKQLLPELQIIMITVYKDYDKIFQALQAGACGYLLKRSGPEEVAQAIAEAHAGGAPMSREIARRVVDAFRKPAATPKQENLSEREREILDLLAGGLANKEIGAKLHLSPFTIRAHLRRIYEKLHVHCRAEAVSKYLRG